MRILLPLVMTTSIAWCQSGPVLLPRLDSAQLRSVTGTVLASLYLAYPSSNFEIYFAGLDHQGMNFYIGSSVGGPIPPLSHAIWSYAAAAGLRAGYFMVVWKDWFELAAIVPMASMGIVPACCLVPYRSTEYTGVLTGTSSQSPYAPTAAGAVIRLETTAAQSSSAITWLMVSLRPARANSSLGSLAIESTSTIAVLGPVLQTGGVAGVSFMVPSSPTLSGLNLFLQGVQADAASPVPIQLTNGLVTTFM